MVCLRNICINTLHKGEDDDNNNNVLLFFIYVYSCLKCFPPFWTLLLFQFFLVISRLLPVYCYLQTLPVCSSFFPQITACATTSTSFGKTHHLFKANSAHNIWHFYIDLICFFFLGGGFGAFALVLLLFCFFPQAHCFCFVSLMFLCIFTVFLFYWCVFVLAL